MVYIALTPNADWNDHFDAALHCHKQRVIIEGVHSDWCNIEAGVPTRSVLILVHYCFSITLRTYQPQSTLTVFYLLEKVLSPSDQYPIGPNSGWQLLMYLKLKQ